MILNGFDDEEFDLVDNYKDVITMFHEQQNTEGLDGEILERMKNFNNRNSEYMKNFENRFKNYVDAINACSKFIPQSQISDFVKWIQLLYFLEIMNGFYMWDSKKRYNIDKTLYKNNPSKSRDFYPQGIMIHCPASNNKGKAEKGIVFNAAKLVPDLIKRNASVHFIIEYNEETKKCEIYSTRSISFQAGHCGKHDEDSNETFNYNLIGIEIFDPKTLRIASHREDEMYVTIDNKNHCISVDDAENTVKQYTATRDTAIDLCAMLCCLFQWDINEMGRAINNKEYPITVISHREGNKHYEKASTHSDPDELWLLYERMKDLKNEKQDLKDYYGLKRIPTSLCKEKIMDPFREEVAQRIEYFKNEPGKIHPILRSMYMKLAYDIK